MDMTFKKILKEVNRPCADNSPIPVSGVDLSWDPESHLTAPNLSLWMSQDTSHSTCPVPPLKPLSPQHTLILPHLSHLSQWHHLPRCSSQYASEPTHSSSSLDHLVQIHPSPHLYSCHKLLDASSISILSLKDWFGVKSKYNTLKISVCSLRMEHRLHNITHLQSPARSDPFLPLQPPPLPPATDNCF